MRLSAPVFGIAAIGLAVALVWHLHPAATPSASRVEDAPSTDREAARDRLPNAPPESAAANEAAAAPLQPDAAPLPGEAPSTPITQFLSDAGGNLNIERAGDLVTGEQEFAAEPRDSRWAPGAEAELLAKFAQVPGLRLLELQAECRSTMCRFQLLQPPGTPGNPSLPFHTLLDSLGLKPRFIMTVVDALPEAEQVPLKSVAYLWREGFAPERENGAPPHELIQLRGL
jgi:hypothetical protein